MLAGKKSQDEGRAKDGDKNPAYSGGREWPGVYTQPHLPEKEFWSIFEQSPNYVYMVKKDRFVYVNHSFATATGYSRDELLDGEVNFCDLLAEECREEIWNLHEKILAGIINKPIKRELVIQTRQNRQITVAAHLAPVHCDDGLAAQGILADMTELKILQDHLAQSEKMAAVGQLLAGVVHEINNVLSPILGFAQLLQMDPDSNCGPQIDMIHKIEEAANRSKLLLESLLLFSRPSNPVKEYCSVNDLLKRTLDLAYPQIKKHDIAADLQLEKNLPWTSVDPNQISQVLLNIVNNALHAVRRVDHHDRRIKLSTSLCDDRIVILISNNGPHIPQSVLDRIFEPFFSTKKSGQGTGLGLSICHNIIQAHQGEIEAENTGRDRGVNFTISLPVTQGMGVFDPQPIHDEHKHFHVRTSHPHCKVLVAEDEVAIREVAVMALENFCQVDSVADGEEAIEKIRQNGCYDLYLVDLRMPRLDGYQLFLWLKDFEQDLEQKMIFMTGDTHDPECIELGKQSGCPILFKPFNVDELEQMVESRLPQPVQENLDENSGAAVAGF
jgi:PAS domain S-box-containing protein